MALTKVSGPLLHGSNDNLGNYVINNITGAAATFTGNVSVGGTLTYDDVTNVDSVGIVTAKGGLHVGAGGTIIHALSSNDGKVGINSTIPDGVLDLYHATNNTILNVKSGDAGAVINITDSNARSSIEQNGTTLKIIADTDGSDADSQIRFQVDGSTKMRVNSDGEVQIGTTSDPTADIKLLVSGNGGVSSGSYFSFRGDYGNVPEPAAYAIKFDSSIFSSAGLHQYAYGGIAFNLGGLDRINFTQNGSVGIGTTNPIDARVRVRGANNSTTQFDDGVMVTSLNETVYKKYSWTGIEAKGGMHFEEATSSFGETMRITTDGNVIIGSGGAWSYPKPLNVQGSSGSILSLYNADTTTYAADTNTAIELKLLTGNTGTQSASCEIRAIKENGTNGDSARVLSFYTGGNAGSPTERLRITSSGITSSISSSDATPNFKFRSDDVNWHGYVNQTVHGGTISSILSCGGTWTVDGTTYNATKDYNGSFGTAALIVHNQYDSTATGGELVFVTKANGSTTTDGAVSERFRVKSTGEFHISDRNSSIVGQHFFQAGAFGIRMEDAGGYNRWNIERNYGGYKPQPVVHLSAQGRVGINTTLPEGTLDVTSEIGPEPLGAIFRKDYGGDTTDSSHKVALTIWGMDHNDLDHTSGTDFYGPMIGFGARNDRGAPNTGDIRAAISYVYNGQLTFHTEAGGSVTDGTNESLRITNKGTTIAYHGAAPSDALTYPSSFRSREGVIGPIYYWPRSYASHSNGGGYDDVSEGGRLELRLVGATGGTKSMFNGGFGVTYGGGGEGIEYNRVRVIFRVSRANTTDGYNANTITFKMQQYYYVGGWTDISNSAWDFNGTDSERGYRWTASHWISSSDFAGGFDVPSIAIKYDNDNGNLGNADIRIAAVYLQYARFS